MADIAASMLVKIGANTAEFSKTLTKTQRDLSAFSKKITGIGTSLIAGFGLLEISKGIINVTGEFQRFGAVLSNTLGSESAAAAAMEQIRQFASATPFEVNELTGAFVKLANQGFTPTAGQLRSLGDLASSTGKSFDQLAEAIIDAQTGEFERLKEFGIRANKEGDKVRFTFKGVQTQVNFTSDAIRQYVLSLGDAEGVSGSMAKISATLEGRISNMKDAYDGFLLSLGEGTSGVMFEAIGALTQLLKVASNFGSEIELVKASLGIKNLEDLSDATKKYALEVAKVDGGKLVSEILAPFDEFSNQVFLLNVETYGNRIKKALMDEGASLSEATFLWDIYLKKRLEAQTAEVQGEKASRKRAIEESKAQAQAFLDAMTVNLPELDSLDSLTAKLKQLTDIRGGRTEKELTKINIAIGAIESKIKRLKDLGNFKEDAIIEPEAIVSPEALKTALSELETFSDGLIGEFKVIEFEFDKMTDHIEKGEFSNKWRLQWMDMTGPVASFATSLAESFGNAIAGTEDFGVSILKALASFAKQVGETLIGIGVAMLAAKVMLKNPYTAIAAGVALVALASALSAGLAKSQQNFNSGGAGGAMASRSSSSSLPLSKSGQEIAVGGEFVIHGDDLRYIINRNNQKNERRRG